MSKKAFTLAEMLITLTIIGVVASLTIPSIIKETQQHEFKTGLKKAVSVLNNAIGTNIAMNGQTPYNMTVNLEEYFIRHMNVIKSTTQLSANNNNHSFYTADGMRFDYLPGLSPILSIGKLYETGESLHYRGSTVSPCGSMGLGDNLRKTKYYPCIMIVDVNGDKGPNDKDTPPGRRRYSEPDGSILSDTFAIMITDSAAIPYGTAAQKAMYGESDK